MAVQKVSSFSILIILMSLVLGSGCETPESDPSAAFRALLVEKSWSSDPAWAGQDPVQVSLFFAQSGRLIIGGVRQGTWALSGNTLSVTGDYGTETTVAPDIGAHHLHLNYGGGLCHLGR